MNHSNNGQNGARPSERSSSRARTADSSAQPFTAAEAARLAEIEARDAVDIAADVAVENVARALWVTSGWGPRDWETGRLPHHEAKREHMRCLAVAALAAMPPADETLRERKLARLRQLAGQWASLSHWDYNGPQKVSQARADSANDAARIVLNVLDGGDLL